jgi:hypothetical protein
MLAPFLQMLAREPQPGLVGRKRFYPKFKETNGCFPDCFSSAGRRIDATYISGYWRALILAVADWKLSNCLQAIYDISVLSICLFRNIAEIG